MNKRCCAVIVTYNIGKALEKCFYSIINQVDKVVVVDNGSNHETIKYLEELEKEHDIEIVYNEKNLGIATALNQGIKYAEINQYEWLLTMDNDSEATNNMVKVMLDTYNSLNNENIKSIFPVHIERNLAEDIEKIKSEYTGEYTFTRCGITSGNLIKVDVFKEVGYLVEELFIDKVDHEICFRLMKENKGMIEVKGAKLLHQLGNATEEKFLNKKIRVSNHSPLRRYYITRNSVYLWGKYKNSNSELDEEINLDKAIFKRELIHICLFESEKLKKLKMIWKGYRDYKKNKFGEFENL